MAVDNGWVFSAKRLYFWNLVAWAFATGILLLKPLLDYLFHYDFIEFSLPTYLTMFAALPGILYFYLLSRKLSSGDLPLAHQTFEKIMKVQTPTGLAALGGAILGVIPFLVNFIGIFTIMGDEETLFGHVWLNLNMMLPWVSLYGFVASYFIARNVNKARIQTLKV